MDHLHGRFILVHILTYCVISAEKACPGFSCVGGGCVSSTSLCDGSPDCPDGSDESQHNCGGRRCQGDEFACGGGRCVPLRHRCDGADHCGDGSDEASCLNCTLDAFRCPPSGPCLPRAKLCDGRPDCPDGRDEGGFLCHAPPLSSSSSSSSSSPAIASCGSSEYGCSDGSCLPLSWRCDRSPDCLDGADERDCDQDECAVANGGCSHQCLDLPMGFMCACPSGMRLLRDNQCEEIDPCLEHDLCDQLCVSTRDGGSGCGCNAGYQLGPGAGQCRANGVTAQLLLSTFEDVQSITVSGRADRDRTMRTTSPGAMATCVATNTLYWAPQAKGSIFRVSMDTSPWTPVLVLRGQGSVSALAVDWIHRQLYWSDQQNGSVTVGALDGPEPRPLIGGLQRPTALAVEPFLGLLFWAESGIFPKIRRAGLDGQDVVTLVASSISNPVAISLDVPRQLLFWADQGARSVSRVDLAGRHRKTVLKSNGYMDQLSGLAVFEGQVYWSDGGSRSVCSRDKHNGSSFRVLLQTSTPPGALVVTHPLLQPTGVPVVPQSPAVEVLPDATFAWILSLIVFLCALLLGLMVCWWWRVELRPPRTLQLQTVLHKESQDPLLHGAPLAPHTGTVKETLFKVDQDTD
ncbi:low-density lipoprotein receptor-related protein 8 [Gadus morhua]|uniref:Low-density lipoprotein receptor-related protein 8-like n=1 Tax=Gadus morhua TaxID=8049 RepID=A0A8C5CUD2_GADMO|nr:low-density lipoprotein receptor-related protein 8-like [Gadus morhua]